MTSLQNQMETSSKNICMFEFALQGGLRVFGELLKKGGHTQIYVPNPTWGNHIPIMQNAGLEVKKYRYYDANISGLEFDNMIKDLKDISEGTVVLLHACAHNVSVYFTRILFNKIAISFIL